MNRARKHDARRGEVIGWLERDEAGFIVTLEIILILTILVIGLFVGLSAVRDSLFRYFAKKQSQEVIVSDGNGAVLGRAAGFDEHEAPLVPFIDRTVPPLAPDPAHRNHRALIGIRDDRFTSREPVYYTGLNCEGTPCMKRPSSERADNQGIDSIPGTGAVSYLYALQGGPTYAIGKTPDEVIPGILYRQTAQECPVSGLGVIGSRYVSQRVEDGDPCESPFVLPLPVEEPFVICAGPAGGLTCPQVSTLDIPGCRTVGGTCACPVGYADTGGGRCCPEGASADGLLGFCEAAQLYVAESVPDFEDPSRNALEGLEPPFSVSLPIDQGEWISVAPDGEDPPHLHGAP